MNKIFSVLAALALTTVAEAQTMNVVVGNVTYAIPAAEAGDMVYSDGTTINIMGKNYALSDITKMYVDNSSVEDNTVAVNYNGTSVTLTVAGNIARYVTPTVNGAHVSIEQSSELSEDEGGEITYLLSGTSTDGEFYLSGSYKTTIALNGLSLTNPSGAAIDIQNGKRIDVSVKNGTENTLTDCSNGEQKACFVIKGHAEFKGKGTLNINGLTKHGIKTSDYMTVKNCTINVLKAVGDGIHANEYFLMESGTININGVGDDGIQTELDDITSTGETTGHEDEDSGNIYLQGGTLTVNITAAAAKGVKAQGDMIISDDVVVNVTTTGNGVYDSDEKDAKGCAGLKTDGNMSITGGNLTLKSTGSGGKCIKSDGTLNISGGTITAACSGTIYKYSNSLTASPKAIKSDGAMTISGGTVNATSSGHEAIESKSTLNVTDGTVYAKGSDDAINSSSHMTFSGGRVMGYSTGNDGIDANGNCYIRGGMVYAIGSSQPEVGIDANTEGGYKLYVSGGTLVAIGGLENNSSLTQTCYSVSSWNKNTWYALYDGSNLALAFKTPTSGGSTLVVSTSGTATLKSGVTTTGGTAIWDGMGYSDCIVSSGSSVTLSSYTGGNGGPGGGGPGGRW